MAKNDIVPKRENDLLVWHDRLLAGATAHATELGLSTQETGNLLADNDDIHNAITASTAADADAKAATAAKKAKIQTTVAHARALAQRIKTAPGYTEVLGETLGIIGAEDTTDLATSKPTLTGKAKDGGIVEIGFTKSTSDGVNLYCRRDGDTGPVFLARDTASPYVDNRPLLVAGKPEVREYRAKYVLSDEEVGDFSDEMVITVAP